MPTNLPSFHDADLVGIRWVGAQELRVDLRLQNADASVMFRGVKFFRVVDFATQNVVERLWSSEQLPDDQAFLVQQLKWATSTVDCPSYLSAGKAEELVDAIKSGRHGLFGVIPSVGAELVVLCEGVEVL
ncbi:MAG TPA: hypothetical protein VGC74_10275 [Stenotrophomonas sp.]|jgi:hypothetical protein